MLPPEMKIRFLWAGIILLALLVGGVLILKKINVVKTAPGGAALSEIKGKGPANAPIEIIEYSDFQCPACKNALPAVQELLTAYPEKIRFVFQHFPLPAHRFSALAHQAAECAAEGNKFWVYHDKLYEEQAIWSGLPDPTETFIRYAQDLDLNLDSFGACLTEDRIRRRILEEKTRGESLKVSSTPTFFINGERVVGPIELKARGQAKVREILGITQSAGNQSVQ